MRYEASEGNEAMQWWARLRGESKQTVPAPGEPSQFPEHAFNRRQQLDADIKLGWLELWVGVGRNQSWPWLDVAVRIGKGWGVFVDHYGPLIKRPDFIAFVPALRDFVEGRQDEVSLRSLGGSMWITLRCDAQGWLRGEAGFTHGVNGQTARFAVWEESLREALPAAEAVVSRITAGAGWGWVPRLGRPDLAPRAALLDPPEPTSSFEGWDRGWGDGEDVAFEYEVDGYGWYGGTIIVGDRRGDFGGGYLTDSKGDLLRAALMLLAGQKRVDVTCHAEPTLTRIEFETIILRTEEGPEPGVPGATQTGCLIRIREIDETGDGDVPEFEAIARSTRAVAEAIYAMALELFRDGAGPWSDAMAALEGALASVPRKPGD